jgi:hypothetical protein
MDNAKLDEWAAKFLGETGSDVDDAVASKYYTTSPGAAFVVLNKCAAEGCKIDLKIADGKVEAECDEGEAKGSVNELAKLMITAAYNCHNGTTEKVEDDGDDAGE